MASATFEQHHIDQLQNHVPLLQVMTLSNLIGLLSNSAIDLQSCSRSVSHIHESSSTVTSMLTCQTVVVSAQHQLHMDILRIQVHTLQSMHRKNAVESVPNADIVQAVVRNVLQQDWAYRTANNTQICQSIAKCTREQMWLRGQREQMLTLQSFIRVKLIEQLPNFHVIQSLVKSVLQHAHFHHTTIRVQYCQSVTRQTQWNYLHMDMLRKNIPVLQSIVRSKPLSSLPSVCILQSQARNMYNENHFQCIVKPALILLCSQQRTLQSMNDVLVITKEKVNLLQSIARAASSTEYNQKLVHCTVHLQAQSKRRPKSWLQVQQAEANIQAVMQEQQLQFTRTRVTLLQQLVREDIEKNQFARALSLSQLRNQMHKHFFGSDDHQEDHDTLAEQVQQVMNILKKETVTSKDRVTSLIQQCKENKDSSLDLSNLDLFELPESLKDCTHITSLNLQGNTLM